MAAMFTLPLLLKIILTCIVLFSLFGYYLNKHTYLFNLRVWLFSQRCYLKVAAAIHELETVWRRPSLHCNPPKNWHSPFFLHRTTTATDLLSIERKPRNTLPYYSERTLWTQAIQQMKQTLHILTVKSLITFVYQLERTDWFSLLQTQKMPQLLPTFSWQASPASTAHSQVGYAAIEKRRDTFESILRFLSDSWATLSYYNL